MRNHWVAQLKRHDKYRSAMEVLDYSSHGCVDVPVWRNFECSGRAVMSFVGWVAVPVVKILARILSQWCDVGRLPFVYDGYLPRWSLLMASNGGAQNNPSPSASALGQNEALSAGCGESIAGCGGYKGAKPKM